MMMEENTNKRIEDIELQKGKKSELIKINQLKFILSIIISAKPEDLKEINSNQLRKLQRHLIIQEYTKSQGIKPLENSPLNYSEQKVLHEYVLNKIKEKCESIFEFIENVNKTNPEIFSSNKTKIKNEILELGEKRKKLLIELLEIKIKKFHILQSISDYKFGPYLKNELDLLVKKFELNGIKASFTKKIIIKNFYTQTEHTKKAIEKIENHINQLLEDK